jgi:hypothetical protein
MDGRRRCRRRTRRETTSRREIRNNPSVTLKSVPSNCI